jgi:hypothetical protein
MLQGDALSVQLFIGAAAISALSVAMTQAGWTHKWFVRGMFFLTAILACASIGWPYFEARIPLVNDGLQTVATSRVAWFFIGIVPATISGMLVSDALRRRRERAARTTPIEWVSVDTAMHQFARQDLIDRYNYVFGEYTRASNHLDSLQEEVEKLEKLAPVVGDVVRPSFATHYAKTCGERDRASKTFGGWEGTHRDCLQALRTNIAAQLQAGSLIAKGFLQPHAAGTPEKTIPPEEWRFLKLDKEKDQAIAPTFSYIALMIAKRPA